MSLSQPAVSLNSELGAGCIDSKTRTVSKPAVQPLRFAFGIHRLDPRGGLEDQCFRIAEELMRRGHAVTAFVAAQAVRADFPVVSIAQRGTLTTNHGLAAEFARSFILQTREGFDRTVVFQPVPGADYLFTADGLRNRPEVSGLRRWMPRFKALTALEAGCFGSESSTKILCLSNVQRSDFVNRYPACADRIDVLPPSLSAERCRPETRTAATRARVRLLYGIPQDVPVWLWAGLQPMTKGLDRVIEALARQPHTHLIIAGPDAGDARVERLVSYATGTWLKPRVHRAGYLKGPDMLDVMASSDLLVHPARVETTGAVILEAIVNGLPVVATELCGFAEHIEASGCGAVVPGNFEQQAFEDAIAGVQRTSGDEMSAKGVAYGRAHTLTGGIAAACDRLEGRPAEA